MGSVKKQYLDDVDFPYQDESVKAYARENHSQAEIMTHITRAIADMLINKKEYIVI